jgi:transposase
VLILDNCTIHKSTALREVIEAHGKFICFIESVLSLKYIAGSMLIFLPPYSPDINPIEESFSAGMGIIIDCYISH